MEENTTPTPTQQPIIVNVPSVDLSGIESNQETIIEALTVMTEKQQMQIEQTKSLYLETQLIALMLFLMFMWKWIKRLFMKRRKIDD